MKLPIQPISQRDSQWKDKKLGTSSVFTIGNFGCLLTCATMVCKYFGKDTDPARLNDEMVKVKGFYNGTFWVWGQLNVVYPDITFDWDLWDKGMFYDIPADLTILDKLLAEGIPPIVQVDFIPGGDVQEHWVVVIGKEGDYLINDPISGETYFFTAKYGDPSRYIFAIRAYRGTISNKFQLSQGGVVLKEYEKNPDDIIGDLQTKVGSLEETLVKKNAEVEDAIAQLKPLREALGQQEKDNTDISNQLLKAREERDKVARELVLAKEDVETLKGEVEVLEAKNKALVSDLKATQAQILQGISVWEHLQWAIKKFLNKK